MSEAWIQLSAVVVQAISSIAMVFVALASLFVSRRALDVTSRAIVRPLEVYFRDEPTIKLYNSGPGVAYNVKVKKHVIHGLRPDPIKKGRIWHIDFKKQALGSTDIVAAHVN